MSARPASPRGCRFQGANTAKLPATRSVTLASELRLVTAKQTEWRRLRLNREGQGGNDGLFFAASTLGEHGAGGPEVGGLETSGAGANSAGEGVDGQASQVNAEKKVVSFDIPAQASRLSSRVVE